MAAGDRCVCQIVIPRDHDESCVFDADRRGEMNGVVPAQAVKLGKFARESRQGVIDANHAELSVQVVDRVDRAAQGVCVDPTQPAGQRRCGACLWVYELTGCDVASSVPELFGEV
jgi:hypothetical protein